MCGRVKMSSDYSELKIRFGIPDAHSAPNIRPRWNAPPTSDLPVVLLDPGTHGRSLAVMHWGLIPFWAKDSKISYSTFNARSEALETKPAYRDAWRRHRRCLVAIDNFYEWKTLTPKEKQPYAIALPDRSIMALAGLWETWKSPGGETLRSCTIITTEANPQMAEIHTRMPVIVDPQDWPTWLGKEPANDEQLKSLMRPYRGRLEMWPVDRRVGNVKNDDPGLSDRIPDGLGLFGS